eukprot:m.73644 g.73644  ORF g.73644 m.73644 type:complete len:559 (+) comp50304_c0_seq15:236-1912(+)
MFRLSKVSTTPRSPVELNDANTDIEEPAMPNAGSAFEIEEGSDDEIEDLVVQRAPSTSVDRATGFLLKSQRVESSSTRLAMIGNVSIGDVDLLCDAVQLNCLADCHQFVLKSGNAIITMQSETFGGNSALHCAAEKNRLQILRMFLQQGVNCNAPNRAGSTPLMYAANGGHQECVLELLLSGAGKFIKNQNGKTALDYARQEKKTEVSILLEGSSEGKPLRVSEQFEIEKRKRQTAEDSLRTIRQELESMQKALQKLAVERESCMVRLEQVEHVLLNDEAELHSMKASMSRLRESLEIEIADHEATKGLLIEEQLDHQKTAEELTEVTQALDLKAKAFQTLDSAYRTECEEQRAFATLSLEMERMKTDAEAARIYQHLLENRARLTLDDLCVLLKYWNLEINEGVLRASNLYPALFEMKPVALKRKLDCNYGTAVALTSFLRKLTNREPLPSPRNGCVELLETALERANCSAIKHLFELQGIADDVLFEMDLEVVGGAHGEVADHGLALERAIQGSLCSCYHACPDTVLSAVVRISMRVVNPSSERLSTGSLLLSVDS